MVDDERLGDKVRQKIEEVEEEQVERRRLQAIGDEYDEQGDKIENLTNEVKNASWLHNKPIRSHEDIAKDYAEEFNIDLTNAKKALFLKPTRYEIQGHDIPSIIKQMRKYRRTLKGQKKIDFTNGIENLIKGYSDHLDECVDNIYWISKYKTSVREMTLNEDKIIKLSKIEDEGTKRKMTDVLCKHWEAKLDRQELNIGKEYSALTKTMTESKKRFKQLLKENPISATPKQEIKKAILKSVCSRPGISSRQIHESLPKKLHDRTTTSIIAKLAREENITSIDGAYYKINDDIKKNIWAYTAAFIDSDGYITMDKSHNPRVGLVATGNRGKAFMLEMQKSLGIGRLHLDQKSPQDTRPVNRLNFYSASDIKKLLTKCRPHFKMKGPNADVLLELIKIKKENKKEDWFTMRKQELFKLMKYYNHSDNKNFNWNEWDIDIDGITKLEANSKMDF